MKSGLFFQSINGKEIENKMKIGKQRKKTKKTEGKWFQFNGKCQKFNLKIELKRNGMSKLVKCNENE